MKKILLLLTLIFSISFGFAIVYENNSDVNHYETEINKYWGSGTAQKVDLILEKWNKNLLLKYKPEVIFKKYEEILLKIQDALSKHISNKIKILLVYVEFKINQFRNLLDIKIHSKQNNTNQLSSFSGDSKNNSTKENINLSGYVLNYETLKRDEILVPVSGEAYGVLGFYIKPLYGDALMNSIVFENVYGNQADYNIKNLYFVSSTGEILSKTKLVNGIAYFSFAKPVNLLRNWNNSFYILATLNPIVSENQTNTKLELNLEKSVNGFETHIITKANGNPANFVNSLFNANTYYFRKSKPIFTAKNQYGRLKAGTNDIYEFTIVSTGSDSVIKKINFEVSISKAYVDTGDVLVYIDNIKYSNVNAYFDDENGYTKLHLIFPAEGYYIGNKPKKFKVVANFKKVYDNGSIYTRLKGISSDTSKVSGLYTGDFSVLWSDNAVRGNLTLDKNDYFTDAKLYFDKVKGWYLKKR